jgi:RNA polymerase-binding transcription factor DksA
MRTISRSFPRSLSREEREIRRRITALRRQRNCRFGVPDLPADGSIDVFEAALGASVEQHEEVVRRRLADKSQALAAALERVREGTYGICRECGGRIPRRRLEAIPTATLCVPCQERIEVAHAA